MNKNMCFHIVACGLLASSFAAFGMEKGTSAPSNSGTASSQPEVSLLDKVEAAEGKILDHAKKADDVLHGIIHDGLEGVQKNPQLITKIAVLAKMDPQAAQGLTEEIEGLAGLVEKADDDLHELIQDIGKVQVSSKVADTTATK